MTCSLIVYLYNPHQVPMKKIPFLFCLLLAGCTGLPLNTTPIEDFEVERYLGVWYEIARLDHSFERGLSQVSATYTMKDDGSIRVVNRGYSKKKQTWKSAEGNAGFVKDTSVGHLKVRFFGPFYSSYVILDIDPAYQYALVCGPNKGYLWLLSRHPILNKSHFNRLVNKAETLGFATDKLLLVDHGPIE